MLSLIPVIAFASTTVHVVDPSGVPLADTSVAVECDTESDQATTDAAGLAQVQLDAEGCWVGAIAEGYGLGIQPLSEQNELALQPTHERRIRVETQLSRPFHRSGRPRLRMAIHGEGGIVGRRWKRSTVVIRPTRNGTRVRYRHRAGRAIGLGWRSIRMPGVGHSIVQNLPASVWEDVLQAALKDLPPGESHLGRAGLFLDWSQTTSVSLRTPGGVRSSDLPAQPLVAHTLLTALATFPRTPFDQELRATAEAIWTPGTAEGTYRTPDGESPVHIVNRDGTWVAYVGSGTRVPCTASADELRCHASLRFGLDLHEHEVLVNTAADTSSLVWTHTETRPTSVQQTRTHATLRTLVDPVPKAIRQQLESMLMPPRAPS